MHQNQRNDFFPPATGCALRHYLVALLLADALIIHYTTTSHHVSLFPFRGKRKISLAAKSDCDLSLRRRFLHFSSLTCIRAAAAFSPFSSIYVFVLREFFPKKIVAWFSQLELFPFPHLSARLRAVLIFLCPFCYALPLLYVYSHFGVL